MTDSEISDLVGDLLRTYYRIGKEHQTFKTSINNRDTLKRYNLFEKTISDNYIIDPTEDNSSSEDANREVNNSEDNEAGDNSEKTKIRSSRIIINDEDRNDEKVWVDDGESILDINENKEDISDDTKSGVNPMLSANKEETRIEPAASQASLGILEVLVQDDISEISSITPKKKSKKKSQAITSVPSIPAQLPPVRFCSSIGKIPTFAQEFFDMSNALFTEFPMNLLNEIKNVKMLYLENNFLTNLPDELFTSLKFLQWLDVRHNKLTTLPATVKHHPSLETILLQGNQFQKLPLELGLITHLKGLQIQDNPLIYPPADILTLGFNTIINFLREQWNADHPDEMVILPQEGKSELTVLCHDPPPVQGISCSTTKLNTSSSIVLPKLYKSSPSIREKSWNYKPSNRCNSSGINASLETKLQWISKLKEKLNKQAAILQKIKDREVLMKWRQDRRSFVESMRKAADRTSDDIPFAVDYVNIPFPNKQQLKIEEKTITKDVNSRMSEISMSLAQLRIDQQSGKLDVATELKRLQEEIGKLSNLQQEIHDLKNLNETSMSKYNVDTLKLKKKYKPPPSIII